MSTFTKFALWLAAGVVLLTGAAFLVISLMFSGTINFGSSERSSTAEMNNPIDDEEIRKLAEDEEEFVVSDESTQEGIPSERIFADRIHHMTHQKVTAAKKWGHLEITDERLDELYAIAEESEYEYRDLYLKTMEQWQDGDFSNAVQVHNIIWNSQNGTVGKATGLMTPDEEMEYKIRHFE